MGTLKDMLASRTPESRQRIEEMAEEMLLETRLYELRETLNISQQMLANSLGISQPSVAAIEQRGNELKISTLKRYVEAMGGRCDWISNCQMASMLGLGFNL